MTYSISKGDHNDKKHTANTLLVTGGLTLTVQYWAGPSHTWEGTNWAAAFAVTTLMLGLDRF